MTPQAFIAKWGPGGPAYNLNEEQGAQSHFIDLCDLLGLPRPGSEPGYVFEQGGRIAGQASGYADVYKRGAFAWENKAPKKNLDAALRQLLGYTLALDNPPLLVVCDRLTIRIHTQFNGHPSERHDIALAQLEQHDTRELLRRVWTAPESFKPRITNRDITEAAAKSFATLAERLRQRGNGPDAVAHFLTQCLFCCFAEDVGLLPGQLFDRLINNRHLTPERLGQNLGNLFHAMKDGGLFGVDDVPWFNGGLFQTIAVPVLDVLDVTELRNAAAKNWSAIDVSIFGTLFERGLDPSKRSQLGAHYTDPATIERIIDPVIRRPLLREWAAARDQIAGFLAKSKKKRRAGYSAGGRHFKATAGDEAYQSAERLYLGFLQKLEQFRVLDPACGSGNFLYLALKCLKDVEHLVNTEAEALGLDRQVELATGPANVLGIELNEYAAELARVTVWIGELQWRLDHGYPFKTNPVLEPLDHIECRDALLSWLPRAAEEAISLPHSAGEGYPLPHSAGEGYSLPRPTGERVGVRGSPEAASADAVARTAGPDSSNAGVWAAQTPGADDPLGARMAPPASAPPTPPRDPAADDGLSPPRPPGERAGVRGHAHDPATEAPWPKADVVVGNPPFLGDKKMRAELGDAYTETLRKTYEGRVPGGADLVCYWFEKARAQMAAGELTLAGLVSTNSIRGGANRKVLDAIADSTRIFEAWSDEAWVNEGAAVRVSLVAFGTSDQAPALDGLPVTAIHADLSAAGEGATTTDLTTAHVLPTNKAVCFMGVTKVGPFDIDGSLAREWLLLPNPNSRPNSDVLKPSWNGLDITRRMRDIWILDFGVELGMESASLYEEPFGFATAEIKPFRATNNRESYRVYWWRHGEARPGLRKLLAPLHRYIVTPEVAKHRVFVWAHAAVLPDKNLQVTARADDTTFGILHSRFHELWSLRMGTSLEDRPRYTPTTCFETFPFPEGLTPADTAHQQTEATAGGALIPAGLADADPSPSFDKLRTGQASPQRGEGAKPDAAVEGLKAHATRIAEAAARLNALREAWLNPPEWTQRVPEVVPLGLDRSPYPDRTVPKPGLSEADAKALQKRTLTHLYNQRPAWLAMAHEALDAAVAAAYGWTDVTPLTSDDEILARLLALNLQRAGLG